MISYNDLVLKSLILYFQILDQWTFQTGIKLNALFRLNHGQNDNTEEII